MVCYGEELQKSFSSPQSAAPGTHAQLNTKGIYQIVSEEKTFSLLHTHETNTLSRSLHGLG